MLEYITAWCGMKITLDLDEDLLVAAKAQAAIERTSLARLIEEGLVLRLRRRTAALPHLPVYAGKRGLVPGVNPLSNKALRDAANDDA